MQFFDFESGRGEQDEDIDVEEDVNDADISDLDR